MITQVVPGVIEALASETISLPTTADRLAPAPQLVNGVEYAEAIFTLAGSESDIAALVKVVELSLLVMLIVRRLETPAQIVLSVKDLEIDGAKTVLTVKVALAGVELVMEPPLPEPLKVPAGIVFTRLPGVVEVTSTDTVQEPGVLPDWAGTVPPFRARVVPPAVAKTLPPQVVAALTGFASLIPV